jgi:hypothetical protein
VSSSSQRLPYEEASQQINADIVHAPLTASSILARQPLLRVVDWHASPSWAGAVRQLRKRFAASAEKNPTGGEATRTQQR